MLCSLHSSPGLLFALYVVLLAVLRSKIENDYALLDAHGGHGTSRPPSVPGLPCFGLAVLLLAVTFSSASQVNDRQLCQIFSFSSHSSCNNVTCNECKTFAALVNWK